jgi:cysteine desulfurase
MDEISKDIYLDNAASAPVSPAIMDFFRNALESSYANQEAIHGAAYHLRKQLEECEQSLLRTLLGEVSGCRVLWTDSGTSAINIALAHPCFSGGEIISTGAEHASMSQALERVSSRIRKVNLRRGMVDMDHLMELLNGDTTLVSIHHVQSETGACQDIAAIGKLVKKLAPQALFMVDTMQSAGKLVIEGSTAIDFCFVSGCKIGAPGGGALIYRDRSYAGTKLSVFYEALRKEKHLISRPNPALCMTLTESVKTLCARQEANWEQVSGLNNLLRETLSERLDVSSEWTVQAESASPYILHFILPGYQGAVLVRMLSAAGVYIASGSACDAETKTPSRALLATGIPSRNAFSGLRISFMPCNTPDDVLALAECLVAVIRNY